nr:hypothetical protein CFP56_60192 [Quercus suber]
MGEVTRMQCGSGVVRQRLLASIHPPFESERAVEISSRATQLGKEDNDSVYHHTISRWWIEPSFGVAELDIPGITSSQPVFVDSFVISSIEIWLTRSRNDRDEEGEEVDRCR